MARKIRDSGLSRWELLFLPKKDLEEGPKGGIGRSLPK